MTPEQFDECTKLVADILLRFQPRDDIKDGLSDHDAGWLLDTIEATVKAHGFLGNGKGAIEGQPYRTAWYIRPMKEAWKRSTDHDEPSMRAQTIVTVLQRAGLIKD